MTLDAFGRVIGIRPVTEPFTVGNKSYTQCHFPGVKYLGPYSSLVAVAGRGTTGGKARLDLVNRIRGRVLVLNAGTDREKEFPVPDSLTE